MPTVDQIKLYLEPQLKKRLDDDAERFQRRSAAEVAREVVIAYLDFWEQIEEGKARLLEEQRTLVFDGVPYLMTHGQSRHRAEPSDDRAPAKARRHALKIAGETENKVKDKK